MDIILTAIACFIGYIIGRIGHVLGGQIRSPHHWIYGLILAIGGMFFVKEYFGIPTIMFGVGLFVSDLDDFIQLKFYGVDAKGKKRFWGID